MVRIITDSAADFEPRELESLNITCIPLTVSFGSEDYQENVNLDKTRFYELLAASQDFPKTAQASPQLLMDLFESAEAAGEEAIYITLSSALSGTYQSAMAVKNMVDSENCFVFDGKNGTGGQRMVVERAVQLRDAGLNAKQIITELESFRDKIVLFACINTLENLYKGGRISQTAYAIGSLAQIKPIIQVDVEGRVAVPAKAMGMRKGMDLLCKRLDIQPMDSDYPLYVMYTSDRTVAETLAQRLEESGYAVPGERIIQVGAAIGTHIGPSACGLVYVEK